MAIKQRFKPTIRGSFSKHRPLEDLARRLANHRHITHLVLLSGLVVQPRCNNQGIERLPGFESSLLGQQNLDVYVRNPQCTARFNITKWPLAIFL